MASDICAFCSKIVPSGKALLILIGYKKRDGDFKAEDIEGVACVEHLGHVMGLSKKDFPLEFTR